MNKMQYLINRIQREIPNEILNITFVPKYSLHELRPTLEYLIKQEIIQNWLIKDCNIVGGIETIISLNGVKTDHVDQGLILHVGFKPTGGKAITSVLSVGYGYNAIAGGAPGIVSALTEPILTSDARCQLVGENVVYVEGFVGTYLTNMRCVLENDHEFNNIAPRALITLGDMAVLAAKAYIYTNMTIRLGNATVVNGIDMSRISDIVSGYADASTMYNEILTTLWPRVSFLSDRVSVNRHIRMIIPG